MILEPGMKVECLTSQRYALGTDAAYYAQRGISFPDVGHIYTIRECTEWRFLSGNPATRAAVRLVEIKNPAVPWTDWIIGEVAFCATRFRPIRNRDTDITIFREIDANVFKRVDA